MSIWSAGKKHRSKLLTYLLAAGVVFVTVSMVQYPKETFESAIVGLNLWWNVVFPALLPFFILSEILMGLGVVHFIGVMLEPLMRPLFNVPGIGAFAMSMGLASGYPMDAVITCKFRQNKLCSPVEAERLLAFTNTADPLFMFGAVAVGMFCIPQLGPIIALAHYVSSFLVGIIYRFHGCNRDKFSCETPAPSPRHGIIYRSFKALYSARQEDNRSIGQLLGDSVKNSMNTILLIGGFIILFSVLLRILQMVGFTTILMALFAAILQLIDFDTNLAPALVNGLFEIDLGTLSASQADAPLVEKVAVASAIIAWSGLSVHGQVASIVIDSGIRMTPYIVARILHALLAAILTILFMNYGQPLADMVSIPVSLSLYSHNTNTFLYWLEHFQQIAFQMALIIIALTIISISFHFIKNIITCEKK